MFEFNWTAYSKYANHSRCCSQHGFLGGGGLYDHLLSTRVLGYDEFHYEANGHNLDMLITLH